MTRLISRDGLGNVREIDVPSAYAGTDNPDSDIVVPEGYKISRTRYGRQSIRTLVRIEDDISGQKDPVIVIPPDPDPDPDPEPPVNPIPAKAIKNSQNGYVRNASGGYVLSS